MNAGVLTLGEFRQLLAQSSMLSSTRLEVPELLASVDADASDASARNGAVSSARVVAHPRLLLRFRFGTTAVAFWKGGQGLTESSQKQLCGSI